MSSRMLSSNMGMLRNHVFPQSPNPNLNDYQTDKRGKFFNKSTLSTNKIEIEENWHCCKIMEEQPQLQKLDKGNISVKSFTSNLTRNLKQPNFLESNGSKPSQINHNMVGLEEDELMRQEQRRQKKKKKELWKLKQKKELENFQQQHLRQQQLERQEQETAKKLIEIQQKEEELQKREQKLREREQQQKEQRMKKIKEEQKLRRARQVEEELRRMQGHKQINNLRGRQKKQEELRMKQKRHHQKNTQKKQEQHEELKRQEDQADEGHLLKKQREREILKKQKDEKLRREEEILKKQKEDKLRRKRDQEEALLRRRRQEKEQSKPHARHTTTTPPPNNNNNIRNGFGASAKYIIMAQQPKVHNNNNKNSKDQGTNMTTLKHRLLIQWAALYPPNNSKVFKPIHVLLTTIHNVFPPVLGVAGHEEYFQKWKPIPLTDVTTGQLPDETKLNKVVRKVRFFLHPDKLPKDLSEQQSFVVKVLWDITSSAWEDFKKTKETTSQN